MRLVARAFGWIAPLLAVLAACETRPPSSSDASSGDASTFATCGTDADCDDRVFCNGEERCRPGAGDARGCVYEPPPCAAPSVCAESLARCVDGCADADADGAPDAACGGDDCDDTDAARFPGAAEVCDDDDRDEDCVPTTFGVRDGDGDGHVDDACCNGATCGDDCDDASGAAHPALAEVCDGVDNDCDGETDEGVRVTLYPDVDGDLRGDRDAAATLGCPSAVGFAATADDCDDGDPMVYGGAPELCDMVDNDCDAVVDDGATTVDWFVDADGDLYGAPGDVIRSCAPVPGRSVRSDDCDDGIAAVHPGAPELCNDRDDDCDPRTNPFDADGDGFDTSACVGVRGSDCDDGDPAVRPGTACPARDHAALSCDAGLCRVTACDPLWADCDDAASNGCETNLRTGLSCGACGVACEAERCADCAGTGTFACVCGCSASECD